MTSDNWTWELDQIQSGLGQQASGDDVRVIMVVCEVKDGNVTRPCPEALREYLGGEGTVFHVRFGDRGWVKTVRGYRPRLVGINTGWFSKADREALCETGVLGLVPANGFITTVGLQSAEGDGDLRPCHAYSIISSTDEPPPEISVFLTSDTNLITGPGENITWNDFAVFLFGACKENLSPDESVRIADGISVVSAAIERLLQTDPPASLVQELTPFNMWPWPLVLLYLAAAQKHPLLSVELKDVGRMGHVWKDLGAGYLVISSGSFQQMTSYALAYLRNCEGSRSCQDLEDAAGGEERRAAVPDKDIPDQDGFVENPSDKTIYLSAKRIRKDYPSLADPHRRLMRILNSHPEIRRWRPHENRLCIHFGDWLAFVESQASSDAQGGSGPSKARSCLKCKGCGHEMTDDWDSPACCPKCGGDVEITTRRHDK